MSAVRNPNANKWRAPEGYKDLGWQFNRRDTEVNDCYTLKHKLREFDNSLYLNRCTDVRM